MDDGTALDGGADIAARCAFKPAVNSARVAALGPNDGGADGIEILPVMDAGATDCGETERATDGAAYVTPAVGPDLLTGVDGARCVAC